MPDLRPYQREALETMLERRRVIYADAPGTGKTATTLSWVAESDCTRTLLVTPLSVLHHWQREAERWVPQLDLVDGRGTPAQRKAHRIEAVLDRRSLIVNYETMRQDIDELITMKWDAVVFDEAHRLKNRQAQVHKAAVKLARRCEHLALVTGTPILNRAEECWASLHLVDPREWSSFWRWANEHFTVEQTTFYGRLQRPITLVKGLRPGHEELLRDEIGDHLIKRPIEELLPQMPAVTETTIEVELSPSERRAYNSMAKKMWVDLDGEITFAANKVTQMTRLRQMASDLNGLGGGYVGAKVRACAELVADLEPEQVVVLCAYKQTVEDLANLIGGPEGVGVSCYTGDQDADERAEALTFFRMGASRVIVGTHSAMGEGVDGLQVARHIVLLDQDWTPARNEQAVARIRRSGQAADAICVYKIVALGTIDELVAEALERKEEIVESIVGGDQ